MFEIYLIIIIFLALLYDFGNGLNDAANSISTIVATRVLTPRSAVILAAFGNFVGPFLIGVAVATTIGRGIINPNVIDFYILFSALIGAIFWTYSITFKGLPISITHSLIGGLIGAGIVKAGLTAIMQSTFIQILIFIALAPVLGFIGGLIFTILILWIFKNFKPSKINRYFKRLQIISSTIYSITHGSNDAQNAMGIIAITLFTAGYLGSEFYVPCWVIILCASTISLGTLVGGWNVIRTMGLRLTKLRPVDGFCAETSGGFVLAFCTMLGIPVSTTHVICGSIMGTGSIKRLSAVRWGIARNIVWAWILTIPLSAIIAAGIYLLISTMI